MLHGFASVAGKIVLVTGQSSDDPQVQAICELFLRNSSSQFAAYVTRGGLRLVKHGLSLERDTLYLAETRLDEELREMLFEQVSRVFATTGLEPFIPPTCIDDVAIRVNLPPANRPAFIAACEQQLAERARDARPGTADLDRLQVVAEGRTSVFIMRPGVGKKKAVTYEMRDFAKHFPAMENYYFGNEFQLGGNDREVIHVAGLKAMVLGGCDAAPRHAMVRDIGRSPTDLHAFLRCSSVDYPVVFISLGGTKVGVGTLTASGCYVGEKELYWRTTSDFAGCLEDGEASDFCTALMTEVDRFLKRNDRTWEDVGMVGMGFPGPCVDGRWYSNNLTRAFRDGVPLADVTHQAIGAIAAQPPPIRVAFDAQCDAGGELYHPRGRLRSDGTPVEEATVLNIATGVACAFIKNGRVLRSDVDFQAYIGSDYDGGAGQIGRHLWFHVQEQSWKYHYLPRGATPKVAGAIRMTEYLSGPALAARLLIKLVESEAVPDVATWIQGRESLARIRSMSAPLLGGIELTELSQQVRREGQYVSTAILAWADKVYQDASPSEAAECVTAFARQIAMDLSAALTAWCRHGNVFQAATLAGERWRV